MSASWQPARQSHPARPLSVLAGWLDYGWAESLLLMLVVAVAIGVVPWFVGVVVLAGELARILAGVTAWL